MFGYRNLGFGAFTVADTTFSVANSARFNDDDSDYMNFCPHKHQPVIESAQLLFGSNEVQLAINQKLLPKVKKQVA